MSKRLLETPRISHTLLCHRWLRASGQYYAKMDSETCLCSVKNQCEMLTQEEWETMGRRGKIYAFGCTKKRLLAEFYHSFWKFRAS